jgi:hypothetical protein
MITKTYLYITMIPVWNSMKDKEYAKLSITLDKEVLTETDDKRNDIPRSTYISRALEYYNSTVPEQEGYRTIVKIVLGPELILHLEQRLKSYLSRKENMLDTCPELHKDQIKELESILEIIRKAQQKSKKELSLHHDQIERLYHMLSDDARDMRGDNSRLKDFRKTDYIMESIERKCRKLNIPSGLWKLDTDDNFEAEGLKWRF